MHKKMAQPAEGATLAEIAETAGPQRVVVFRNRTADVELWEVRPGKDPWAIVHSTYALGYSPTGAGNFACIAPCGSPTPMDAGSVCLFRPGDVQRTVRTSNGGGDMQLVLIAPAVFERVAGAPRFSGPIALTAETTARLSQLSDNLRNKALPANDPDPVVPRLAELLRELRLHLIAPPRAAVNHPRAVKHARSLIHNTQSHRISLEELAGEINVSRFHLARIFRTHIGLAPHQYAIRLRMSRAMELMRQGSRPSVVATQAGFSDQPHMTRVFRSDLGITPHAFWAGNPPPRQTDL